MSAQDVIIERLDVLKEDVNEIKEHVKYTNGKVASLIAWRSWITGGMTVISILILPVAIYSIEQFFSNKNDDEIDKKIQKAIVDTLDDYQPTIK